MIATIWLKRAIGLVLLGLLLAAVLAAAAGAAQLLAYFQRGADPQAALNLVPNTPADLAVRVEWTADAPDTGRGLEPFTRELLTASYLRAWLQLNNSYGRGEPYGLKTYFSGPALAAVTEAVQAASADSQRVEQVDTNHELTLQFYSADGSIVALTASNVTVSQIITDRAGQVLYAGTTSSDYDLVLLLEDGNWRIRHMVRRPPAAPPAAAAAPIACARCVSAPPGSRTLLLAGQPFAVRGFNYYPQDAPWDRFWVNYDPQVIAADFAHIHQLGLNTVRVFVPFTQFGGAHVLPQLRDRLADLLDRADAAGLKVIVTLFDFRTDYRLVLWPEADQHLAQLMPPLAAHPALLAWDLKNEPDKDYASAGQATVDLWLEHILVQARHYAGGRPLTIGWSSAQSAATLAKTLDLVSFHFYAPAAELGPAYQTLRARVPDRPLLLGEFGLSSWNSFLLPNGHSEPEQAAYYADLLTVLRTTDAGFLVWTLHDFGYVPDSVAGRWPWQKLPEYQLGVLRADGSPKPAAALLAPGARLDTVIRPPWWAQFLKPFWISVFCVVCGVSALLSIRRRLITKHN